MHIKNSHTSFYLSKGTVGTPDPGRVSETVTNPRMQRIAKDIPSLTVFVDVIRVPLIFLFSQLTDPSFPQFPQAT